MNKIFAAFTVISLVFFITIGNARNGNVPDSHYIQWLEQQSMLHSAREVAQKFSGQSAQWQSAYAMPQTERVVKKASVWLEIYPSALIVSPNQTILQFLSASQFWDLLSDIGIKMLAIGPIRQSGAIINHHYTPTQDGWFDPITLAIDRDFGTIDQYQILHDNALKHGIYIAGNLVPGHTGLGADFLLAERAYKDYPGLYDMVEIASKDWSVLPVIKNEWQITPLTPHQVKILKLKNYIPGSLPRVLFSEPAAAKAAVTGWSATGEITGVDGKKRRWVYLHYFKEGQPTLNWLDPSFAANRLLAGQIVQSLHSWHDKILRLDANAYLGIEPKANSLETWSYYHPLSIAATNQMAWLIRKLGGWSYQEFNSNFEHLKESMRYGTDLTYDFVTRPAVEHALLTGDASFLRLILQLMIKHDIKPNQLIHDMQSHDGIIYELPHFILHHQDEFIYKQRLITGKKLRDTLIAEMHRAAFKTTYAYNYPIKDGLAATLTSLCATRLKLSDIYHLTPAEVEKIRQMHLLLVLFNAMQPGVFAVSGWDLVGSLPLEAKNIAHLLVDGDYRWVTRGAYDLLTANAEVNSTFYRIPKAKSLYGPIASQLNDPSSFVSQLKHILAARQKYGLHLAEQIAIPAPQNDSAIIMINRLPNNLGIAITALNFGDQDVKETIDLSAIPALKPINLRHKNSVDMLTNKNDSKIDQSGLIEITIGSLAGKILLIKFGTHHYINAK